jgi:hypothetical protein
MAGLGLPDQKIYRTPQLRPSQPPSKPALATEKWVLESPAGES